MRYQMRVVVIASLALLASTVTLAQEPGAASKATIEANKKLQEYLPFSNTQDFTDARKGFIADVPNPVIKGADGNVVIDLSAYDFLKKEGPAPDT